MTVEEALVAVLALVASVFLFLGLAQALGTSPGVRRRPANHGERQPVSRRGGQLAGPTTPVPTTVPANRVEGESGEPR